MNWIVRLIESVYEVAEKPVSAECDRSGMLRRRRGACVATATGRFTELWVTTLVDTFFLIEVRDT